MRPCQWIHAIGTDAVRECQTKTGFVFTRSVGLTRGHILER